MRILLVEDDSMIGQSLSLTLKENNYACDWVKDGAIALRTLECQHYDFVLLDLGLPGKGGIEVLRGLRQSGNSVPVLIMTARDGIEDRILGLDSGADDYLVKPFEVNELLARIRAIHRRKGGAASPLLTNGVLSLDPAYCNVCVGDSAPLALSSREYTLLHALMVRPGAILSRAELEEKIYGWGDEIESNAVEVIIHTLRKKLGREQIKNVRGLGWYVAK